MKQYIALNAMPSFSSIHAAAPMVIEVVLRDQWYNNKRQNADQDLGKCRLQRDYIVFRN